MKKSDEMVFKCLTAFAVACLMALRTSAMAAGAAAVADARKAVAEDLKAVGDAQKTGHWMHMRAPLMNAQAIAEGVGFQHFPAEVTNYLARGISQIRKSTPVEQITCPGCNGKKTIPFTQTSTKKCPRCGGTGKVKRIMEPGDIGATMKEGRDEYVKSCKLAGRVEEGNALVFPTTVEGISIQQKAKLRRQAAAPCGACHGFGYRACKNCDGVGKVKCNAKGCEVGVVAPEQIGLAAGKALPKQGVFDRSPIKGPTLGDVTIKMPRDCTTCKGQGETACSACKGKAVIACPYCKGSGNNINCVRCGGSGLDNFNKDSLCTLCKGDGYYKGVFSPTINIAVDPWGVASPESANRHECHEQNSNDPWGVASPESANP